MSSFLPPLSSLLLLGLLLGLPPSAASSPAGDTSSPPVPCPSLPSSLIYTQASAPREIGSAIRLVVEQVNKELTGVVDVNVHWTGQELHRKVGRHNITATVVRRSLTGEGGYTEAEECFEVPFVIDDTDECKLPEGHEMAHGCGASARCVNSVGAYHCECPAPPPPAKDGAARDPSWSLSLRSSSCPGLAGTEGCCADGDAACRAAFKCPQDPCQEGQNTCDAAAGSACESSLGPDGPEYTCTCPGGKLGSGHLCAGGDLPPRPTVGYDSLPTEETLAAGYCSCTEPAFDKCKGFPPCEGKNEGCSLSAAGEPECECKTGYVRAGAHGCVDETPPALSLRCDADGTGVMALTQGENYEECAVDIADSNAEDLARSLKIAYSAPLPRGCLRDMGTWHVNYTVATPWTEPAFQLATRTVTVTDLDECAITARTQALYCKEALPQCDKAADARCRNTEGSYQCECPRCTAGDGFLPISGVAPGDPHAPVGYEGGTGCRDSCKPAIELRGPNPRVFRACKCGGLVGLTGDARKLAGGKGGEGEGRSYDAEIKALVRLAGGKELCATKENAGEVEAGDCAQAVDQPGGVDLTGKIVVGDPVKHPTKKNWWRVAYNVADKAGNRADTVFRDVKVEELSLEELEEVIRKEAEEEKEKEVRKAVAAAVKKEKQAAAKAVREATDKAAADARGNRRCPECPKCVTHDCDCGGDVGLVMRELTECQEKGAGGGGGASLADGLSVVANVEHLIPLFLLLIITSSGIGLALIVLQRAKQIIGGGGSGGAGAAVAGTPMTNSERALQLKSTVATFHSPRHGRSPGAGSAAGSPATPGSAGSAVGGGGRPHGASPLFGAGAGGAGAGLAQGGPAGSPSPAKLPPITPMRTGGYSTRSSRR
ncbi:hypothetical protein TeGR_g6612 [Tetraparma gracilis]|uniref:EGF-like calcium-binding domain-containing protein n=1 Tax=Tetraparma gracilis TaxID=2962635 RepID=A0ABQ6N069_9STRA|nr:hypothetical protein TeGR_g6612 [Tetraparma gracilis]